MKFTAKQRTVQVGVVIDPRGGCIGTVPMAQLVVTEENGQAFMLPWEQFSQQYEPADAEAAAFFVKLKDTVDRQMEGTKRFTEQQYGVAPFAPTELFGSEKKPE